MEKIIAFLAAILVLVAFCAIAVAAPASRDGTAIANSTSIVADIPAVALDQPAVTISPHAAIATRIILSEKTLRLNGDGARPGSEGYDIDKGAVTPTRVWPIVAVLM